MSSFSITQISQTTSAVAIAGPSVVPLTTVFTPPQGCNAESLYETAYSSGGTIGYNTDPGVETSSCYPPSYRDYQFEGTGWYSPGVCPSAYEWVATSLDGPTTLAICCPPGFSTKGAQWSCTQIQTNQLPGEASVTIAFANPISVAWQSSDLKLFTPASAPILALASQTGGSLSVSKTASTSYGGTTASRNSTLATPGNIGSSDLSTGAAAGVGVGATIAGLAIIGGMIFWFFHRHKSDETKLKGGKSAAAEQRNIYGEPDMQSPMNMKSPVELDASGNIHEAADTAVPAEADPGAVRVELEGDLGGAEKSGDVSRNTSMKDGSESG